MGNGWENGGYVKCSRKGELEIVYPGIQGAVVLYSLMLSRHGIHTALWDQHCGAYRQSIHSWF